VRRSANGENESNLSKISRGVSRFLLSVFRVSAFVGVVRFDWGSAGSAAPCFRGSARRFRHARYNPLPPPWSFEIGPLVARPGPLGFPHHSAAFRTKPQHSAGKISTTTLSIYAAASLLRSSRDDGQRPLILWRCPGFVSTRTCEKPKSSDMTKRDFLRT